MRYFEDFQVGEVFQFAPYKVTEEEMLAFAKAYDPQYYHVDKEAAANTMFGGIIASGWHVGAIFMRMQCDSFLSDSACIVSPGIDELRWLQPVKPGDTLSGTNEVLATRESQSKPDRGIVSCAVVIRNQNDDDVMTLKTSAFFEKRP